ncbi:unnamed protein product [Rotaria sordida]|uniref:Uncharacterized protein n=1 Tax=Rotaria sordida TaxID=392033 RepID=A0A818TQG7_9BILA|nr:unnamed protein product [Rotaria sordida]
MENTELSVQNNETTPVVESVVTEETSKTNDEQPISEDTSKTDVEQPISEDTTTNDEQVLTKDISKTNDEEPSAVTTEETTPVIENKEEEVAPPPPTTTTEEETVTSTDEQENVTGTNSTVPTAIGSPSRMNVPLKEVNESEKEEQTILTNGKKRELEQEEEKSDATNDNDERTGDQTKKIKISETTDTPIMETKETENMMVNGNTPVEYLNRTTIEFSYYGNLRIRFFRAHYNYGVVGDMAFELAENKLHSSPRVVNVFDVVRCELEIDFRNALQKSCLLNGGMQPESIGRNEYSRYDQIGHFPGWRDMNEIIDDCCKLEDLGAHIDDDPEISIIQMESFIRISQQEVLDRLENLFIKSVFGQ